MTHITIAADSQAFFAYTVSGSTTGPFTIPFEFFDLDDVVVLWKPTGGSEVTLVRDTDYSVAATAITGGYEKDGTVTLLAAKSNGVLTVKADYTIARTTDFPKPGSFDTNELNTQLDRIFAIQKQLASLYNRALRLPDTSALTEIYMPDPAADEILKWNTGATALETATLASLSTSVDTLFSTPADSDFLVFNGTSWVNEVPATARTSMGLGTAATLNVGTSANNIVQLDGTAKLPAVDGSQLTNLPVAGGLATGSVMQYVGTTAPTGWLMLNGDTIGSAASGATQAHADNENLFTLFWDSMADAQAPVSSGRGASAAADWAANKTLTMPDARGRMQIGTGTGAGLTARTHGDKGGSEDAIAVSHSHTAGTLAAASGGAHTHSVALGAGVADGIGGGSGVFVSVGPTSTDSQGAHGHSMTGSTASAGSSGTGANMQPWLALNVIVKQ